jgi:hypothetical protein
MAAARAFRLISVLFPVRRSLPASFIDGWREGSNVRARLWGHTRPTVNPGAPHPAGGRISNNFDFS